MGRYTRAEFLGKSAKVAGAFSLAGGALAQAACGGSSSGGNASAASSKSTLTVWMHQGPTFQKAYQKIVKQFEQQHPGVKINSLYIPYTQFESKALIAFTGGSPPDVVKLGGWDIANYASKGLIAAADANALGYSSSAAFHAAYSPGALESVSNHGTVYGLPIDYNSIFLFYRRDHFEAAGLDPDKPPTTWEQVVAYAQKLTKRNSQGNLTRAGWAYWYNLPIWDFLNFLPLPVGLGGGLLNAKNEGTLSSPASIQALTWYADLSTKLKVASPQFTNPNNNYGQIADGTASMTVSGNFATSFIETESKLKLGKEFDVAPIPQWSNATGRVTSGYSWAWLVADKSSNKKLAWEFLRFVEEAQNVSPILSVSDLIIPIKGWEGGPVARHSKGAQIVAQELPYTNYGPRLPQWTQMAQQLSNNLGALALGQKSPQQAASDFDTAMQHFA